MKHATFSIATLALFVLSACSPSSKDQDPTETDDTSQETDDSDDFRLIEGDPQISVMTYNVMCSSLCKYDKSEDGWNDGWDPDWKTRVPYLQDVISRHSPDLMGLQELGTVDLTNPDQVTQLGDPSVYGAVFYHAQEGDRSKYDYPDGTVYYKLSRFKLIDSGHFWLGPAPEDAYSSGWADKPSLARVMSWAKLFDRVTGKELYFATTHYDNNFPNQVYAAHLTLDRFKDKAADAPFILTADFNSRPNSEAYGILTNGDENSGDFHFEDTYDLTTTPPAAVTNTTPAPTFDADDRIDHILLSGGTFDVSSWEIDLYRYGPAEQAPSDHTGAIVSKLTIE